MQIDWITVGAQILNFLVLVWLLNLMLYRPVTRAMVAREALIRERFAKAEQREEEAIREAERHRAERAALDDRRAEILAATEQEAHSLMHRLEGEVRDEITEQRDAWTRQLQTEQERFLGELRHHVSGHVGRVARRVLSDLAGAALEATIVEAFIARISGVEAKTLTELQNEVKEAGGVVYIESAFVLGAECKTRLEDAVRQTISPELRFHFREEAGLICGVRLRIRGKSLQWSVDDYLESLQEETDALLDAAAGEHPAAAVGKR